MEKMTWSFWRIWNQSLEQREERILKPRDRIWATEIGGAFVDRYLKMKGVQPSNPPNARSLRKFEAGNIWESIVGYVLSRAGILKKRGEWLKYQYPGLLPVAGKLDFIAGGEPDYDEAFMLIQKEFDWLPEFISRATQTIVQRLKEQYPNGLAEIILEIKSCSSFMFELYEKKNEASPHHKFQNFHYLKAKDYREGHIVYVCKDDARIIEIGVLNPSALEGDYRKDIEIMTSYYNSNTQPPLEKPIVFNKWFTKFSANWKVEYSQYLTYLYGLKDQKEFDDRYKPVVERWNRVLERIAEGKDMTDNNKAAIGEMEREGFNIEEIKKYIVKKDG